MQNMKQEIEEFVLSRLQMAMDDLEETNEEYRNAQQERRDLADWIEPVLTASDSVTLSAADCHKIARLLELEIDCAGELQEAVYKQGFADCVGLMHSCGLVRSNGENKKALNQTGANIRRARQNAGLTQEQLAAALREQQFEVSRQTISQMENGKQRILDFQLAAMAKALNVSIDALYGRDPSENP